LSTQDSSFRSADDRTIANAIVDQLTARIGPARFDLWFSGPNCIRQASSEKFRNCISVVADSDFAVQRLQNTFGQEIRHAVDRICGPHFQVDYRVARAEEHSAGKAFPNSNCNIEEAVGESRRATANSDQSGQPSPTTSLQTAWSPQSPAAEKSRQTAKRKPLGLGSFWFGEENRLAKASAEQLFEQPGQFSPFLVYGPTGSGKTHLVEAIVNDFRRKLNMRRCVFLSAEQFTSLFVNSLRGGSGLPLFRRKYRDLDLLAIDDVQFLAGKRATLNEFQYTVDNLIRNGKQVVVSADRPPLELSALGGDLSARLTAGLTCPLRYPDFEGRLHIARQMCSQRRFSLSADVLELICDRLTRDVRRLSGALNRLHAIAVSSKLKITPEIAQTELCDLFSIGSGNSTNMVSIEQAVCEFCGIKPAELKSASRRKQICTARMLAMYLSREYTSSALSEIGDYFGGRSHSTVIAARRKVSHWLEQNEGVSLPHATYPAKDVISRIESNLRIG
jgi:chromosomal replication initiator protein